MAYWNKISRPKISPKYDLGFDFWWFDPVKAKNLKDDKKNSMINKKNDKDNSGIYLLIIFLIFILWKVKKKIS